MRFNNNLIEIIIISESKIWVATHIIINTLTSGYFKF